MSESALVYKKLALLHILKNIDKGLTRAKLVEFVLRYDIMNYFELQQFLDELIHSQLVETIAEAGELCLITENGSKMIDLFADRVPASVREIITEGLVTYIQENSQKAIQEGEFVKIGENDYMVTLRLQEGSRLLLKLELNAFTVDQARTMVSNWKNHTTDVYQNIMASLETTYSGDLTTHLETDVPH